MGEMLDRLTVAIANAPKEDAAKAAISALKVPSPDMLVEFAKLVSSNKPIREIELWEAMIEVALRA